MYERKCTHCGLPVQVESICATIVKCDACRVKLGLSPKEKRNYDTDDFIYCRICNKVKRSIRAHLKASHSFTVDQYLEQYPDALIESKSSASKRAKSSDTRQKMSDSAKNSWSDEIVRKHRVDAMLLNPSMKGKELSEEHKRKIADSVHETKSKDRWRTLDRRKVRKYDRKSELKEYVVCPLCMKETGDEVVSRVGLMTLSHVKRHNYSLQRFRDEYPFVRISRGAERLVWEQSFDKSEYDKIVEQAKMSSLQDTQSVIYCRYCKEAVKRISARHLDMHKLTVTMYQQLFPDAPLVTKDVVVVSTRNMLNKVSTVNTINKGYYGFRHDIGHFVRSMIEANFCRILKLRNVSYEYEPTVFSLNHEVYSAYAPDVLLLDDFEKWSKHSYIELKNVIDRQAYEKVDTFRQQYPDKVIEFLAKRSPEWKSLERKYRHLIPLWETGSQNVRV
jgi:hypothetical protein